MKYDDTFSIMKEFDKFVTEAEAEKETLTEAEEVSFDSLDKKDQTTIKKIQIVLGTKKISGVWDGIHGKIVDFDDDRQMAMPNNNVRIASSQFRVWQKMPKEVRWIEIGQRGISVGF